NNISRSANLRVGQHLKLSGSPEPVQEVVTETQEKNVKSDTHIVKSGETLSSIARQYHLQLRYLADLNGLSTTSNVRIGQRLKINEDIQIAKKEPVVKVATKSASSKATESYTVKSGESLIAIANRVGVPVTDLASLINLSPRAGLRVGQTLQLPKLVTEYKVKRGDTLIGLASRYGMATNELAEMNELKPNTQLRIGDVIKVPN
ncbi:MAG: LysM peptidoglycan-binding domain-containing protein, partial [Acinetobacter sp.]